MTTKNEHLSGIQARIEELQNTITEKEAKIKARSRQFKDDLEAELSPVELVRRYPLKAVATTFIAGFLVTRSLKGPRNPRKTMPADSCVAQESSSSQNSKALAAIGLDILRSAKDLGFTYLQRYIDKKIR
ncbi:hypothetical protein [Chlorobium sp. KB01]|uniref:hypothetical protein n=1 Tax=Chlorobium sp. KB01 TaxID=1917528 RepID=UPI000976E986|nr:hypothetical protein [Chlorobium sp. KB01]